MKTWIHPVWIESPWERLQNWISSQSYDGIYVLVDDNSSEYCLGYFTNMFSEKKFYTIQIRPGEEHKNLETCAYIWSALSKLHANRNSLLIALGGGVITDIGGFCAATYHRGMDVLHIPTTLLSMADAALGGKTGIDLGALKNQVGSTHMPVAVLIDPYFLNTLAPQELHSGFAEICKHALLADPEFWNQIISMGPQPWKNAMHWPMLLEGAIPVKMELVTKDPSEKSIRKSLNYGHTVGHALESLFLKNNTPISHGWAVAAGMQIENQLAVELGIMKPEVLNQMNQKLSEWYPKLSFEGHQADEILSFMFSDKKNRHGSIAFSLIADIGQMTTLVQVQDESIILLAIKAYK